MEKGHPKLNQLFCDTIVTEYLEYCTDRTLIPDLVNFIEFMVIHNLVREITIRRYMTLHLYDRYIREERENSEWGAQTAAVYRITELVPITERHTYTIIKNYSMQFTPQWAKLTKV